MIGKMGIQYSKLSLCQKASLWAKMPQVSQCDRGLEKEAGRPGKYTYLFLVDIRGRIRNSKIQEGFCKILKTSQNFTTKCIRLFEHNKVSEVLVRFEVVRRWIWNESWPIPAQRDPFVACG